MKKKLNIRQEKFCQKYLECGVAVEAMLHAYPSRRKWKRDTQDNAAYKLSQNGEILARLKELQQESRQRSVITRDRILEELSKIAFTSVADCHSNWGEVLDFEKLTPEQKAAIRSISAKKAVTNSGEIIEAVHIEMHDKIKALERICKMLGYDQPEKHDILLSDTVSREELERELKRLERLDK